MDGQEKLRRCLWQGDVDDVFAEERMRVPVYDANYNNERTRRMATPFGDSS